VNLGNGRCGTQTATRVVIVAINRHTVTTIIESFPKVKAPPIDREPDGN
jgi:hypothetical protein